MHKFWMVKGPGPTTQCHYIFLEASDEACRLAEANPGHWYVVMEAVEAVRKPRPDLERVRLESDMDIYSSTCSS